MIALVDRKNFVVSILLKFGVSLYLAKLCFYGTEPHHDGYILGSAAAVADSLPVHSGAFSQYGPMTPWIAGLFLKLTSVSVFNLRVLSAIVAFVIYLIMGRIIYNLGFSRFISQLVSTSWVLINHVTTTEFDGTFFLWPSLISTLFLILALDFALASIKHRDNKWLLVVSGILISFASFTRIQSLLVLAILTTYVLIVFHKIQKLLYLFAGVCIGSFLIVGNLVILGSFRDYVEQVLIWPASFYSSIGLGTNYDKFLFTLFLSLPIASILYFRLGNRILGKFTGLKRLILVVLFGVTTFAVSVYSGNLLESDENTLLRLVIGDQLNRVIFWPLYLCFMGSIVLAGSILIKRFNKEDLRRLEIVFIASFGLSVTPQIFPKPDIGHVWWISPLLIPPTLVLMRNLRINLTAYGLPLVSILIAGLMSTSHYLLQEWTPYTYEPLVGTFAKQERVESMKVYEPLTKFLKKNNALFLCENGIHAAAARRYAANDQWFVSWGPRSLADENTRLQAASNIVVCDEPKRTAEEISIKYGMQVIYFSEVKNSDTYTSLAIMSKAK